MTRRQVKGTSKIADPADNIYSEPLAASSHKANLSAHESHTGSADLFAADEGRAALDLEINWQSEHVQKADQLLRCTHDATRTDGTMLRPVLLKEGARYGNASRTAIHQ